MIREKFIDRLRKKYQSGGMYDQMQQYQMGGQQLPGGEMQPIPGSDAVQFNGQTHDEGGIMMDSQTEVEDGETMDQVNMAKKGGKRDYFFSSYLKTGGRSFADAHKEILANGGDQQEINMLAKMQEKAAGRNPNQVAKLGGVMKYQEGGESPSEGRVEEMYNRAQKILANNPDANTLQEKSKVLQENGFEQNDINLVYNYDITENDDPALFQSSFLKDDVNIFEPSNKKLEAAKAYTVSANDLEKQEDGTYIPKEGAISTENDRAIFKGGQWTDNPDYMDSGVVNQVMPPEPSFQASDSTLTIDRNPNIGPSNYNLKDDVLGDGVTVTGEPEKDPYSQEVPGLAYAGMGAGLGAGLYSLFHKQPDAEQAEYTPGFTSPVVAERGKLPRLERYSYNQDIANVGREVRGMNKYIESSGGGPANMVNKMMAFSRGQQAKDKIRAAETRANIGVQNTESQLRQSMELDNLRRQQQASTFNAQMARAEAARQDQIDEANTARRQKVQDDREFQKYAGVSSIASSIQTGLGDILDYKADMARSQAIGAGAGNVQRDAQLINAGYIPDGKGGWKKANAKFGGLRRLQNYNR